MELQVYADESGTHAGAPAPTLCGFIDTEENWDKFRRSWKLVLNDFRAPHFHFKEFHKARASHPGSPYYGWSKSKRREFLHDLAFVAGLSAIPTGGASHAEKNRSLGNSKTPFDEVITIFFEGLCSSLDTNWPGFGGKVRLVFDQCKQNKEWLSVLRRIHSHFAEKDSRIGGLTFEDDRDRRYTALQSADLLAYTFCQHVKRHIGSNGEETVIRVINFILYKNMDVRLRRMGKDAWADFVKCMREDEIIQKAKWSKEGDRERIYDPDKHFNFDKYKDRLNRMRGL
jgi:hypothetical protein